jgi:hypothetical protein
MAKGMAIDDVLSNFVVNPIDDTVTSGIKAWSSQKINNELSQKATNASVSALEQNVSDIEDVLATKADSSELGNQVSFSYNSSTLTLTITNLG